MNFTCKGLRRNKATFPGGAGWVGAGERGPWGVVQTNPIRPGRAGKTIAKAGGLDAATRRSQSCQTNPISAEATRGASALWKRNYGKLTSKRGSTKQSQFASLSRRGGGTGPKGEGRQSRVAGANRAKRTQFPGSGAEPIVRNEANSPRTAVGETASAAGRVNRAKQSQFPRSDMRGKSFMGKELWLI